MKNKKTKKYHFLILLFIILFISFKYIPILLQQKINIDTISAFTQNTMNLIFIIIGSMFMLSLSKRLFLWLETEYKVILPNLIRSLTTGLIVLIAFLLIVSFVFGKDISLIFLSSGIITTGILYAAKDVLNSFIIGIITDFEGPYKLHEYIEILNKNIKGKVIKKNWRSTTLLTSNKNHINVPNSLILNNGFINHSRPDMSVNQKLEFYFRNSLPIERMKRIIKGALYSTKMSSFIPTFSINILNNAIKVSIKFTCDKPSVINSSKEEIIILIHKHLAQLDLLHTLVTNYDTKYDYTREIDNSQISNLDYIKKYPFFQNISKDKIDIITKNIIQKYYKQGEVITNQYNDDKSILFIKEGIVELSNNNNNKKTNKYYVSGDYLDSKNSLSENKKADVICHTSCILLQLNADIVRPLIHKQ